MSAAGQIGASPKKTRGPARATLELRDCILDILADGDDETSWTVRQLYYAVTVVGGVPKTEGGYRRVQRQVLEMRRAGLIDYRVIADNTRWVRRAPVYDTLADWVDESLRKLRIDLWRDADERVECWIEKDALAGVLVSVTARWHVPLYVTRGYASETFAYEAASNAVNDGRRFRIIYLGDFDSSGVQMARDLERRLRGFLADDEPLLTFDRIAVTPKQIDDWSLPSRPNKTTDTRHAAFAREFPGYEATELDAIRPERLRELVEGEILSMIEPEQVRSIRREEADARILAETITRRMRGRS